MPSYRLDGSRVAQLLARLRRLELTYQASCEEFAQAERRMGKWKAQLGQSYHRGLFEATHGAILTISEELDEDVVTSLSGPPQEVYGTGAELSRVLDIAADMEMDASDLREMITCDHAMTGQDLPDGGVARRCEACGAEPDVLDELGIAYDSSTPCRICDERGGNGSVRDREGDLVPCYECTVGAA